jgi:hypothetical protein
MADNTVDQAKLVMNTFAAHFENNLVAADAVTWKQYDGEMTERNRFQISEQVPPRYNVTETVDGVVDLSAGVQDSVFGSEQYTVNRTFGSSMGWGDFVAIRDIGDARKSEAIKSAALNLAEKIDAHVLRTAALASSNWTGTAGSAVADFDDFVSGYTRLKEEGVDDSDLRGILNYSDKQALGSDVVDLPAPDGMVTKTFREGFTGQIGGIPVVFTQQLPTLTVGTRAASGAAAMNGASQNVNYSDVAISAAPGQYKTQTISINGLTGTQTVNDGEVFTIANVNAWDERLGASLGRPQQFRVIGNYTATGGAIANLRIFPAIIVPGSGTGGDIGVNTAHATVDSVPGATAAITFLGAASAQVRPRVILQKQAIIVNTKALIKPATGISEFKQLDKVPISVRMWADSVFGTGEHRVRFDVALTANVRDRRRIVRINGS